MPPLEEFVLNIEVETIIYQLSCKRSTLKRGQTEPSLFDVAVLFLFMQIQKLASSSSVLWILFLESFMKVLHFVVLFFISFSAKSYQEPLSFQELEQCQLSEAQRHSVDVDPYSICLPSSIHGPKMKSLCEMFEVYNAKSRSSFQILLVGSFGSLFMLSFSYFVLDAAPLSVFSSLFLLSGAFLFNFRKLRHYNSALSMISVCMEEQRELQESEIIVREIRRVERTNPTSY